MTTDAPHPAAAAAFTALVETLRASGVALAGETLMRRVFDAGVQQGRTEAVAQEERS